MNFRNFVIVMITLGLTACSGGKDDTAIVNNDEGAMQPENPLLAAWDTPYGVPPFERIRSADYLPALRAGMQEQMQEIAAIVANPDAAPVRMAVNAVPSNSPVGRPVSASNITTNPWMNGSPRDGL